MSRRPTRSSVEPETRRVAIYTRKSTTMGLEQEFNSLDSQRESCLAYIQRQPGWKLVDAVSYIHLDVYKRQSHCSTSDASSLRV